MTDFIMFFFFFFKQKTAYDMRISDWSSDVCSSDLVEDWANAVEMREDIELGNQNDAVTLNAIWELANPLITQPLTPAVAKRLIDSFIGEIGRASCRERVCKYV